MKNPGKILFMASEITATGNRTQYPRFVSELPSLDETIQMSVQPAFQELLESAERDGWVFAEKVALYRDQSPRRKLAFAELLAEKCPGALLKHFPNFEIPKEHHLRLALACVQQAGQSFLLHHKQFDLSPEERGQVLVEVAKKCPREMAEALEDMNEPLDTRKKLARTIASIDGRAAATFYKNFRIPEPTTRFEDAKLAFTNNPVQSAKSIDEFELAEECERFELLKKVVAQDPAKTLSLAKVFRITRQDYLYELAQTHAAHDGWSFCYQFAEWNIVDQNRLLTLFKSAAAQNGRGIIQNRGKLPFDNDKVLELIEIASRQCGE